MRLISAAALVLANGALQRVGLRRRADGWRRGVGLVLRQETATFVLSTFGLDVWSDGQRPELVTADGSRQHAAERLERFLAGQKLAHVCVKRGKDEDCAAVFGGASYSLGFEDWIEGPGRFVRPVKWEGAYCSPGIGGSV